MKYAIHFVLMVVVLMLLSLMAHFSTIPAAEEKDKLLTSRIEFLENRVHVQERQLNDLEKKVNLSRKH